MLSSAPLLVSLPLVGDSTSRPPRRGGKSRDSKKLTQCEIVRSALEQDIFTGRLAPATRLDEDAIAQRFSVSRTPVREALLQLIETGLVEKPSRQRALVAPLDVRRLIQSFEALSELEAVCARFAARRMTGQEKEELVEIQQASDAALLAGDDEEYGRLGVRFHVAIWRGTHNDVLFETTRSLSVRLMPFRMFQLLYKGRPEANNDDHKALLALILAGSSEESYVLMRGHVTVQGDVLAEYMSGSPRVGAPTEYG